MPKTKTAESYTIEEIRVSVDEANQITAYIVQANVRYGDTNIREQFDLWSAANAARRSQAQAIQGLVKQYLDQQILA